MKRALRYAAVTAAIIATSAVTAPAAQAATIYPPSGACSVAAAVASPNSRIAFECQDGTFSPNERVVITVNGATRTTIGMVKFATTSTGSGTSTSTGALASGITFPSDASGVYTVTATSETSTGGSGTITVVTSSTGGGGALPATGIDSNQLLGLWVGGGALVLAGGALAVATAVRRNRKHAER